MSVQYGRSSPGRLYAKGCLWCQPWYASPKVFASGSKGMSTARHVPLALANLARSASVTGSGCEWNITLKYSVRDWHRTPLIMLQYTAHAGPSVA